MVSTALHTFMITSTNQNTGSIGSHVMEENVLESMIVIESLFQVILKYR